MNYHKIIYQSGLMKLNIYNINKIIYLRRYKLTSHFCTSGNVGSNQKLVNLLNYLIIFTNQRPCLSFVNVHYYRKKIIKDLLFEISLGHRNGINFLMYIIRFYNHFFNIYFQYDLKYSFLPTCLKLYLDNPHFFLKSYSKQGYQFRFNFFMNKIINKSDFLYLSNYHFLNIIER